MHAGDYAILHTCDSFYLCQCSYYRHLLEISKIYRFN